MEPRDNSSPEDALGQFVLEHGSDAIVVLDADGAVVASSEACRALFTADALDAWFADRSAEIAAFRDALRADGRASAELDATTRDGTVRRLQLDGSTIGARHVVVIRDATRARAAADELAHLRRVQSAGLLALSAMHDLNNLLTPILCLSARLAENRLDGGADARGLAREITAAAERAAVISRRLLAYGRRGPARVTRFNPNDALLELRVLIELVLGAGASVVLLLDERLGDVNLDREAFEHVVLNLVANARDAMPHGGRLSISTANTTLDDTPGAFAAIVLEDNGVGITADVGAQVLEPYFTTKPAGTGLGLASAKRFADESGGRIALRSRAGEGTAVTLCLPRADVAGDEHGGPSPVATPPLPGGTEVVLVVEHNDLMRRAVQRVLESNGYAVLAAASGDAALRLAREYAGRVDLVVADVSLPDIGGRLLIEQLGRVGGGGPRALLMSGHPPRVLAQHGVDGMRVPFLAKPFGLEELLGSVREALDGEAAHARCANG